MGNSRASEREIGQKVRLSRFFFIKPISCHLCEPGRQKNNMETFAVYGEKDAGKSTTCYKLFELLRQAGATVIQLSPASFPKNYNYGDDFQATLSYKGKIVLITSDGDDCSIIDRHVNRAIALVPDRFILAIRSRVWYKGSIARLQSKTGTTIRYFALPGGQSNAAQNASEIQVANSIFPLI